MDLQNAVAIVTGSSSGVGQACARQLAEKGCHVVINYSSNEAGARDTETQCQALGVETEVVQADVAQDGDCQRLVAAAESRWGRLDALVNNAGTTKFCDHANLDGLDKQDFLDIYSVNTVGVYQMIRAALPLLKRTGNGAVVNVASMAGITGVGSSIAYTASKGALITMGLSLARVVGPEVRLNTICPGFIQGDWLEKGLGAENYARTKDYLEKASPIGVTATADSVAQSILMFIDGADVVTGETLMVDGGLHLSTVPLARR